MITTTKQEKGYIVSKRRRTSDEFKEIGTIQFTYTRFGFYPRPDIYLTIQDMRAISQEIQRIRREELAYIKKQARKKAK